MAEKTFAEIAAVYRQRLENDGMSVDCVVGYDIDDEAVANDCFSIPVLVVSPDISENYLDDLKKLRAAAWEVDARIEPTPVSAEKWKKAEEYPKLCHIKQTGVEAR